MKLTAVIAAICAASWALTGAAFAGHDDHPGLGIAAPAALFPDNPIRPDDRAASGV